MKKFKHKATGRIAYPFSVPSGEGCYTTDKGGVIPGDFIENSKDWEEIKELIYKIQAYRHINTNNIWTRDENGFKFVNLGPLLENTFDNKFYEIYSIERLSDNVIFTVDDTLHLAYGLHKIKSIKLVNGQIVLICKNQDSCTGWSKTCSCTVLLKNAEKLQKAFTTEDGKHIYSGDSYFYIHENKIFERKAQQSKYQGIKNFYWSTKEKAEAYLESIKPKHLFITKDGIKIFKDHKSGLKWDYLPYVDLNSFYMGECGIESPYAKKYAEGNKTALIFSTKEKAEEYLWYNKPCLSINDVAKIYVTANWTNPNYKQPIKLLKLVKEKLKL